jgi:hypothetical protein
MGSAVLSAVKQRLSEQAVGFEELEIAEGCRVVVTARGGCVLGPFWGREGEGLLWVEPSFGSREGFARLVADGAWDLGGERVRIAPDGGSGACLGAHHVAAGGLGVRLRQDLVLEAKVVAAGRKHLSLERAVRPCPDPLRSRDDRRSLGRAVRYAGYEQEVTLLEASRDGVASEARVSVRLHPGGTLVVPTIGEAEYRDGCGPVGPEHQTVEPGCVRLRLTGDRRFRVAYKAGCIWGRMGYLFLTPGGQAALLVRSFFANPCAAYADDQPASAGARGFPLHVRSGGAEAAGLAEFECSGEPVGGAEGRSEATNLFKMWTWVGEPDRLADIARALLGVPMR